MENQERIKMFSTPNCPYCVMLKQYLSDKKISYENIDVSEDQNAANQMFEKSHNMGVPQLWIKDQVVVGFDVEQINEMLEIK